MFHVFNRADGLRMPQNRDHGVSRDQEPHLAAGAPTRIAMEFMWMVEPCSPCGSLLPTATRPSTVDAEKSLRRIAGFVDRVTEARLAFYQAGAKLLSSEVAQ